MGRNEIIMALVSMRTSVRAMRTTRGRASKSARSATRCHAAKPSAKQINPAAMTAVSGIVASVAAAGPAIAAPENVLFNLVAPSSDNLPALMVPLICLVLPACAMAQLFIFLEEYVRLEFLYCSIQNKAKIFVCIFFLNLEVFNAG